MCTMVPPNHQGPVPGVEVGMTWKFRVQASRQLCINLTTRIGGIPLCVSTFLLLQMSESFAVLRKICWLFSCYVDQVSFLLWEEFKLDCISDRDYIFYQRSRCKISNISV